MNTIESYQFGLIVVNDRKYSSDIIISPDGIISDWWRKRGHELCLKDITEVITEEPEVLIVGTGDTGLMRVLPEVPPEVEARDIKLMVEPTNEACDTYNQLCHLQKVVAALHLTC